MNANERTIEIENTFGKKRVITREEFVSRWSNVLAEAWAIADTNEEFGRIRQMQAEIAEMAGRRFDTLWAIEVAKVSRASEKKETK